LPYFRLNGDEQQAAPDHSVKQTFMNNNMTIIANTTKSIAFDEDRSFFFLRKKERKLETYKTTCPKSQSLFSALDWFSQFRGNE
jgi:hypothetical protein